MPILQVQALPQSSPDKIQPALKATCAAIAKVYGCKIEQVWATWNEIKPDLYIEGLSAAKTQPESSHPPIAQLICFEGKSSEEIENLLSVAASTLSENLGISKNIFITYHEAMSGRVIAGNEIVRRK